VYAGYSAGGCVLARRLHGVGLLVDPESYVPPEIWTPRLYEGVGVMQELIVPHIGSPSNNITDGVDDATRMLRFLEETGAAHISLRDGEVLVIKGGERTIFRQPPLLNKSV
jgi:dipeptidase E